MNESELKDALIHLTNEYVDDPKMKKKILFEIDTHVPDAVKGILRDITENSRKTVSPEDSEKIKRIAFYFC